MTMSSPLPKVCGAIALCTAMCAAQNAGNPSSIPVLVSQTGGAASVNKVLFGRSNAWVAVADGNARMRIFDVATGRMSRVITMSAAANNFSPPALAEHPEKDILAAVDLE